MYGDSAAPSEAKLREPSPKGPIAVSIALARPDHWFKNVFMLPGAALAVALGDNAISLDAAGSLLVGLIAACLIASANYTINEWLDAEFDRHHPEKRFRPSATGLVAAPRAYAQWGVLSLAGLVLAGSLNPQFCLFAGAFCIMGLVYNVNPLRTKDRPYLDVLSEAVNNPLRFMLGWSAIVNDTLPPSSILLAFWMGGAYLMAIKRYAEFRHIADPATAGKYRRSFQFYTEESLLVSAFFYALSSAFLLGVFLIKYKIEFLLAVPLMALLFAWYLKIGMRADSVTQKPEKLYKERTFVLYVAFLGSLMTLLFFVELPWLDVLVEYHVLRAR